MIWGKENLSKEEVEGKDILEVGSLNVNGSLRDYVQGFEPSSYVGIDIRPGLGVDRVQPIETFTDGWGFDLIIATEVLEHIKDWRKAVEMIKFNCKLNGIILLTTRSIGFPVHNEPDDFWRFGKGDLVGIFSDCKILKIEPDPQVPGIFIKVQKPQGFFPTDLKHIAVYGMKEGKRV